MVALYEERLSIADTRRYELEDLVVALEEQLKAQARPVSPGAMARKAASAAEIDNEMLREQVQHLQKRIATIEDELEDTRATHEREEVAVHERIKRYKEREEVVRKELAEGKKDIELVRKSEEKARSRVEELEEALRENSATLENARAEIETLRHEIAVSSLSSGYVAVLVAELVRFAVQDLEGLAAAAANASSDKLSELAPRANSERTRMQEEIAELKQQLAQSKAQSASGLDLRALEDELHSLQEDRETVGVRSIYGIPSVVLTRPTAATVAQADTGRACRRARDCGGAACPRQRTHRRVGYYSQEAQPGRLREWA